MRLHHVTREVAFEPRPSSKAKAWLGGLSLPTDSLPAARHGWHQKSNVKDRTAQKLGIKAKDLDFRIYPTNVKTESQHQFVAVFQDRSALIDMGTPTCITWQEVGADAEIYVRFSMDKKGMVIGFEIPQLDVKMERAA